MNTLNLLSSPRTPHIKRIWTDLCAEKEVPQLDRWLVNRLKQDKRFGSKDRRFYADAVFAIMRRALALDELKDYEPMVAWQKIRDWEVHSFFEAIEKLDKTASGGLSPWFNSYLDERIKASAWSAQQKSDFLTKLLTRAPLWLRLNHLDKKPRLEKLLGELNVPFENSGFAYKMLVEKNFTGTPVIEDGLAEVQDYGSQLLGLSVQVKDGGTIWDACAGGGGKSLQLASLHPRAYVYASDVRAYKSTELLKRSARAKLKNVHPVLWDGSTHFDRPNKAAQGFDVILVDAPCSGSGTWRRSPDGRFKISKANLGELHDLQFSIIKKVLPHLKAGGELVYATCSWLVEENEAVVNRAARELGLTIIEQTMKGSPDTDADTLFVARLRVQV
ncbi:MAG: RsmB/NOP family class I SAM-dependent RNA methyltransferase [Proteobacteria bacterium]|nr:MAG: RsmB/NOP family class I SAM-dependent RNA methyltransferase [Pseudomonadota bacterium]